MTGLVQTSGMPQLPQEIIDYIIAELDHQPRALCRFALVSRAFRPQAQRLLFSYVFLDNDNPNRLKQLAQILAQNPSLGRYTQSVDLWLNSRDRMSSHRSDESGLAQAVHDLERILRACHIRELFIMRVRLTKDSLRILLGANLPYLKQLRLASVSSTPTARLRDVLSKLPPLDQLELGLTHLFVNEDVSTSQEHKPVHVNRLHVTADSRLSDHFRHLALASLCAGIKELKLRMMSEELADLVTQVLQFCGAELLQLHLHITVRRVLLRESLRFFLVEFADSQYHSSM
jgi:hypothetical protein